MASAEQASAPGDGVDRPIASGGARSDGQGLEQVIDVVRTRALDDGLQRRCDPLGGETVEPGPALGGRGGPQSRGGCRPTNQPPSADHAGNHPNGEITACVTDERLVRDPTRHTARAEPDPPHSRPTATVDVSPGRRGGPRDR